MISLTDFKSVSVDPTATGDNLKRNFNAWPLNYLPSDYAVGKLNGGWAPNGVFTPTWEFYDSFDPAGKRRTLMVTEYTNNISLKEAFNETIL